MDYIYYKAWNLGKVLIGGSAYQIYWIKLKHSFRLLHDQAIFLIYLVFFISFMQQSNYLIKLFSSYFIYFWIKIEDIILTTPYTTKTPLYIYLLVYFLKTNKKIYIFKLNYEKSDFWARYRPPSRDIQALFTDLLCILNW